MRAPAGVCLRRTARVLGQLLRSWFTAVVVVPRLERGRRRRMATRLAMRTLDALDVRLLVRGAVPAGDEPLLLVGNHVSWLDVYALNAVIGARFVAKSETGRWPLVGAITRGFEAIFIVRGSVRDAARVQTTVAAALRAGERVVVFPEATTTEGTRLKQFHPALFQAAVDAGVRVQPVAIRYPDADGQPDRRVAFIDDMSFVGSVARVLQAHALRVEVTFGEPMSPAGKTRRELARHAQRAIADHLGLESWSIETGGQSQRSRRPRTAA